MGKREDDRMASEVLALDGIGKETDWMTAKEITMRLGFRGKGDLYRVACALRRLAEKGEIEENVVKVDSEHRAYELRKVYRKRGTPPGLLMSWLNPKITFAVEQMSIRVIKGRASMK